VAVAAHSKGSSRDVVDGFRKGYVGNSAGAPSAAVAVVELIGRERIMSRPFGRGLGTMLVIAITSAIVAAPAAARVTGKESFRGVLLA
jgi:hypothetical protein